MEPKYIRIKGARVHNLKNIDVNIPKNSMTVITGLSGSGKSSLAFDTLYAEGHRRFVESLSSYARQFLGQTDKPDVDSIEGLSPAIAIDQKTTSNNPRSTVGTVTEIYDYLRLLFARVGIPHCPICGKEIKAIPTDVILDNIKAMEEGTKFIVLAPVVKDKKGTHEKLFSECLKNGYTRARVDGEMIELTEVPELDKNKMHNIEIVIDRLVLKQGIDSRLADSVETALKLGNNNVEILNMEDDKIITYSQNYACEEHNFTMSALEPRLFSFNAPLGACPTCSGIGFIQTLSRDRIIPDKSLSIKEGAIDVPGFLNADEESWGGSLLVEVGKAYGFTLDTKIEDMNKIQLDALFDGCGQQTFHVVRAFEGRIHDGPAKWRGLFNTIKNRRDQLWSDKYEEYYDSIPCPECQGKRLKPEVLCVTVGGKNIQDVCDMSVLDSLDFFENLNLSHEDMQISKEVNKEIKSRLTFLKNVGLGYLNLSRQATTLSGGEAQRIRLATQIGSSLSGVMYILDEPSIGLHQRDNARLIETLKGLRDEGNTVIVVEHDTETMESADYIIDMGPGAGIHGGEIVAEGTPAQLCKSKNSLTGKYLSGRLSIAVPKERRKGTGEYLTVVGAAQNNLKNITVKIPLGKFTCITGVSGSGKSSLIEGVLLPKLEKELNRANTFPGKCQSIEGYEHLDKVISIDQSPIGRTPRSNPATYTGLFSDIRDLFSKTPDAKTRGYGPGRFSFNVPGGRCEACMGDGVKCIEMNFLPDVYVKCDVCQGRRYNKETLEVKYKGKNIYEILEMSVEEGLQFFENIPKIRKKLQTIFDVGLGYIKIGQSSTTLSGGEAQRVKLATELSRASTGKTIYILDEPTTGLHSYDVECLLGILNRLTDAGNTVVVIEHNLDVIKTADHIIDLGPEGGEGGGTIVAEGTPEEVAKVEKSFTGQFLKKTFSPKL